MAYEDHASQQSRGYSDSGLEGALFIAVLLIFIGMIWAAVASNIKRERNLEAQRKAAAIAYQHSLAEQKHEPTSSSQGSAE